MQRDLRPVGIHRERITAAATDNLPDEHAEFLINDRMSFMRFLGLSLAERVPDARTIWLFREKLTKAGAIDALFARFDAALRASGFIAMSGQIVDAALISPQRLRARLCDGASVGFFRVFSWLRYVPLDASWFVFGQDRECCDPHHQRRDYHLAHFMHRQRAKFSITALHHGMRILSSDE
jgi:IS5 family transposase